jgi:hypothetical protein
LFVPFLLIIICGIGSARGRRRGGDDAIADTPMRSSLAATIPSAATAAANGGSGIQLPKLVDAPQQQPSSSPTNSHQQQQQQSVAM